MTVNTLRFVKLSFEKALSIFQQSVTLPFVCQLLTDSYD